jgi:hypothetical protein
LEVSGELGAAALGIFVRTKNTLGSWRKSMMGWWSSGRVRERRLGCDAIRATWREALRADFFGTAEAVP